MERKQGISMGESNSVLSTFK